MLLSYEHLAVFFVSQIFFSIVFFFSFIHFILERVVVFGKELQKIRAQMPSANDETTVKAARTQKATNNLQQRIEIIGGSQTCVDAFSRILCFRLE